MDKPLLTTLLFVCLCTVSTQADVVYSQPWTSQATNYSDLGHNLILIDDFTLNDNCLITDVHWWGSYGGTPPATDDFTIDFIDYSTAPSLPAAFSFNVGDVGRTPTPTNPYIYLYSCYLPTPVSVTPGTTCCISIYNNTPSGNWGWMSGQYENGLYWWHSNPNDTYLRVMDKDWDLAFELTTDGDIIPEPVTSFLFIGAVLGGLVRLRRRS